MTHVNTDGKRPADFIGELMRAQFDLYAHIVRLMGGSEDAYDVLQETNQQILRLDGQRDGVVHFLAWAKRMAYFQVRTWRTRQRRDQLILDEALFEQMAAYVAAEEHPVSERVHALNECMKKLPDKRRELFLARYVDGAAVQDLAARENRSPDSLSVTLHRIRVALRTCITKRLMAEQTNG